MPVFKTSGKHDFMYRYGYISHDQQYGINVEEIERLLKKKKNEEERADLVNAMIDMIINGEKDKENE